MNKDNKSEESFDIPGMELDNQYSPKKTPLPEDHEKTKKELEKTKKELEKLKIFIIKKYPFTQAIGILPPQSIKNFVEEEVGEDIPQEELQKIQKKVHIYVIIPEDKFNEIPNIKKENVSQIDKR